MDILDKINEVLDDFVEWDGGDSSDAADSEADDLDAPGAAPNEKHNGGSRC